MRARSASVGRLAERRGADEVAEEDGDDLALLARRLGDRQGRAARAAEPRVVRVLAPAARRNARSPEVARREAVESRRDRAAETTLPFCS
jgi:hypothetical protein